MQIPYRRTDGPLNLLVDSTDIKFPGEGEWQARKLGVQRRRQWRKVHLAMNMATSDIRAVEFTPGSDGDSPVLPELPAQIPEGEDIGTVTVDGAYDTRRCHTAIIDRQATPIIPIRKSGRAWKKGLTGSKRAQRNPACNPALRQSILEAMDRIPRPKPYCGKDALAGSLEPVALNLLDLKASGERIPARDPDRKTAEIQIRIALIKRFDALGTAKIVRVA